MHLPAHRRRTYGCDVKQAQWVRVAGSALLAATIIAAAAVVLSVYKIAPGPPNLADEEAGYLATEALAVCVALAAAIVLTYAVAIAYESPSLRLARRGF